MQGVSMECSPPIRHSSQDSLETCALSVVLPSGKVLVEEVMRKSDSLATLVQQTRAALGGNMVSLASSAGQMLPSTASIASAGLSEGDVITAVASWFNPELVLLLCRRCSPLTSLVGRSYHVVFDLWYADKVVKTWYLLSSNLKWPIALTPDRSSVVIAEGADPSLFLDPEGLLALSSGDLEGVEVLDVAELVLQAGLP
eukprot:TRINITY_DN48918_c0_g1_i1.p1 TRINITY_DN48918_c0_g1~~TRINITY_DN48918_c0_g1_i1.p1  ORF type:complete len:199 (+),score=33.41 TRINITY_DN48918_c0_g1_i1:41-637(+)